MKNNLLNVAFLVFAMNALSSQAQTCNLEKSGNALTGTTYLVSASMPTLNTQNAIAAIRSKLEAVGQKIITSDLAQGTLQAEQPGKAGGRALPIVVTVKPVSNETYVAVAIRLNPLQLAPDEGVKTELCSYVMAAKQGSLDVIAQSAPTNPAQSNPSSAQSLPQSTSANAGQQTVNTEFIKNGYPCLSGVCIGDDITQIKGVNWETINPILKSSLRSASDSEVADLRKKLIAPDSSLRQIASALSSNIFSANAIAALGGVEMACAPFGTFGMTNTAYFKSQSGQITKVVFEPAAKENQPKQVFRVTTIFRNYVDAVTEKQKDDLREALEKSYYPVISTYNLAYSKQGAFSSVKIQRAMQKGLDIFLTEPSNVQLNRQDLLLQNTQCGGSKVIPVN
jgi:hypothetical protein